MIDIVARVAAYNDRSYGYNSIYAVVVKKGTLSVKVAKQRNQWLCENRWERPEGKTKGYIS